MTYRITGLDPEPFAPLFDLDDDALAARQIRRVTVREPNSTPCRVGLEDGRPGDEMLLLNFEHLPVASPYRARHAIYVNRRATRAFDAVDSLPPVFAGRQLALRGFDGNGMLRAAELVEGTDSAAAIARLLAISGIAFLHAHYAAPGCFAARIDRA